PASSPTSPGCARSRTSFGPSSQGLDYRNESLLRKGRARLRPSREPHENRLGRSLALPKHGHWEQTLKRQTFAQRSVKGAFVRTTNVMEKDWNVRECGSTVIQRVTLTDAERGHILGALRETGWVVAGPKGAAARLGMKR